MEEPVFHGIAASGGVAIGSTMLIGRSTREAPPKTQSDIGLDGEIARLKEALVATRKEILGVQHQVTEAIGADEARIFEAHLLALEDQTLIDEALKILREESVGAEYAFWAASEKFLRALEAIEDGFLRERAADMRDVTDRVMRNLTGESTPEELLQLMDEPRILIGHDVPPSMAASIRPGQILAFVTETGGKTSHTAIIARSLKIPAIVGLKDITERVTAGTEALVDGVNGLLILNPSDQTKFEYGQFIEKRTSVDRMLEGVRDEPPVTLDGHRIRLSANIESADNIQAVLDRRADGVGLFRTEYLFLNRSSFPTEEEQFQAYRQVVAGLAPRPVVIRTLDLGGDKLLSIMSSESEMNPFLGWRAIRFCLQRPEVFRTQLRAILRASAYGVVKMMYPMITCLDEVIDANQYLEECKDALRLEGIPFDENMAVGVMIETPSAAVTADTLADSAEFFSIGTNDLVQYCLAVDRLNEKIAHLYEPTNPAILRLIKSTVEAAHQKGRTVSVCGEMAGEPIYAPLLLGLGVDELSVAPPLIDQCKFVIRNLNLSDARALAERALSVGRGCEALAEAEAFTRRIASELFRGER